MKKTEIKKLDTLWSLKVKEDAKFRCELTGLQKGQCQLHSHHFIGRRHRSLRWWLPNGVCLSASSHTMSIWSAHENPEWFRGQMIDLRGREWLKESEMRSHQTFKGNYQTVKDYLDGKIKDYL